MDIVLLPGLLVLLAVLSGSGWLLWHVLRQHARLLLRLEAMETRLPEAGHAPQGNSAPLAGREVGTPVVSGESVESNQAMGLRSHIVLERSAALQLTSFDDIRKHHRHIFLSPHFDDVVYSCGGTLGVQVYAGLHPLVITVFGGVPGAPVELSSFALRGHQRAGFGTDIEAVVRARRQEDANALNYIQADYLWLDYPDAIYRGTPTYYSSREQLRGGDVHPGDLLIGRELAEKLLELHERLPDIVWYAPLGVGEHVDHQIVSSAIGRLIQRGANVNLYEDFPYVLRPNALQDRLNFFGGTLEPTLVEMSAMLPLRRQASAMYASQIERNFVDKAAMFKAMESYTHSIRPVETIHFERYWS